MSALPRFSIDTYSDACKQERGLLGWDQRYTQMSRGRFEGFVAHMDFGRVSLSEERLNVSVAQNAAPPPDKVVLVLPVPSRDSRINGVQCEGPGFLHMGGHEISIVTAETTQGYYVTVAEKDLWGLDRRRTGPLCSIVAYPGAAELSNWIASLMSTAPDALRRSPRELSAVLPDLIIDRVSDLCTCLSARDHKPLTESYAQSVVRKARRIMEARSRDQLSITQLAQALDLPAHVLRSAFVQAAGVSPLIWLRQHRLDHARRAMLTPDEACKGVAQIAMENGFFHLGRFAAYYAQTFHELPIETIRSVLG